MELWHGRRDAKVAKERSAEKCDHSFTKRSVSALSAVAMRTKYTPGLTSARSSVQRFRLMASCRTMRPCRSVSVSMAGALSERSMRTIPFAGFGKRRAEDALAPVIPVKITGTATDGAEVHPNPSTTITW